MACCVCWRQVLGMTDDVLAVSKPACMPVHVAGQHRKNTVCGRLQVASAHVCSRTCQSACKLDATAAAQQRMHRRSQMAVPAVQALRPDLGQLHPVHRLDKPVSGVLLLARSPAAAARLNAKVAVRTCLRPQSVLRPRVAVV
jgi:tRNA pseudouridine32 synthase